MRKTFKYRIYPTKKQTITLNQHLEKCRWLYNYFLGQRKSAYENEGESISCFEQQSQIPSIEATKGIIHSQVLQDVTKRVDLAYKAFFRRVKSGEKPGYPRFKGIGRYDSITYPQQPSFRLTEHGLRLSKIGNIKIKLHRPIKGIAKTCIIRKNGSHWYACISCEYEIDIVTQKENTNPIGVDVGLTSFATLSNGDKVNNPRHLRKNEKILKQRQRSLSHKKRGSANRKKARVKVKDTYRKVTNQRNDFHHKVSRAIVDSFTAIAVEDLTIKNMVKNHYLAKSISDAGWGCFLDMLQYKAAEAGTGFERVAPHYTSIICSGCGNRVTKTLAIRIHRCLDCGLSICRDQNAAINILQKSKYRRDYGNLRLGDMPAVRLAA